MDRKEEYWLAVSHDCDKLLIDAQKVAEQYKMVLEWRPFVGAPHSEYYSPGATPVFRNPNGIVTLSMYTASWKFETKDVSCSGFRTYVDALMAFAKHK